MLRERLAQDDAGRAVSSRDLRLRQPEGASGTMPGPTMYDTVNYCPIRWATMPGRSEVDASAGSDEGLGAACNAQPGLFHALDAGAEQVGVHVEHPERGNALTK